ncbi:hypothetical protein G6F66_015165 [Rhizopus arrhizus]|nr:hypothetical protein G6F66_015165 [Rhizopus arrhizus]
MRVFAETDQRRHRARVHAGETYASMQLAVLLANRSGPLTAIEWSQAWARAQDMAERFDATIEGPDQQAVLEQGARLDDTCAALDTQSCPSLATRVSWRTATAWPGPPKTA